MRGECSFGEVRGDTLEEKGEVSEKRMCLGRTERRMCFRSRQKRGRG